MEQIVAIALCLGAATLVGYLARRLRLPGVLGVMSAGVVLGVGISASAPSVPALAQLTTHRGVLDGISTVAIVIFMAVLGHELRTSPGIVGSPPWRAVAACLCVTAIPMAAGVALAPLTWRAWGGETIPLVAFAIAQGCLFTMTAVPVLQRILVEAGLGSTPAGRFALTQSLVTDVVGWACLAVVIAVTTSSDLLGTILWAGLLAVAGISGRLVFALSRVRQAPRARRMIVLGALILGVAILAKLLDESPLLSGLIFGLILPRTEQMSSTLDELNRYNLQWLFPLFFVSVGVTLGTADVTAGPALSVWIVLLVLVCAFVVKWIASWTGGRLAGMGHVESSSAASLLSVRGATELALAAALAEAAVLSTEGLRVFVGFAILSTVVAAGLVIAQVATRRRRQSSPEPMSATSGTFA